MTPEMAIKAELYCHCEQSEAIKLFRSTLLENTISDCPTKNPTKQANYNQFLIIDICILP